MKMDVVVIMVFCQVISADKEKFSIFLRTVPAAVNSTMLREAYSSFGVIRQVDVISAKNMAFIEFASTESAAKCVGVSVTVGTDVLIAEERKKGVKSFNRTGSTGNGGKFVGGGPSGGRSSNFERGRGGGTNANGQNRGNSTAPN
jgi:RNA recognition motif-containing protein